MKKHWLVKSNNESLLIIALGWSCDESAVSHITPTDWDVLCLYDYRKIELLTPLEIEGYKRVTLIGWSFGVWAAEHIFNNIKFTRTIAINGSPFPVNEEYGISPRVLDVTIKGIRDGGIEKFNRRVYGDFFDDNPHHVSKREFAEQLEELQVLRVEGAKEHDSKLYWDRAIISRRDPIFPLSSLSNFWGHGVIITEMTHYPFADPQFIYTQIND